MKIRNKNTGQIHEVLEGTIYPSFFEEVKDEPKYEEIKVGEPKIEYEIEEVKEEPKKQEKKPKKAKKTTKKSAKKGTRKNGKTDSGK